MLKCTNCGGLIRPDVVWFGEMLPVKELKYAENAAADSDVFFTIGTSAEVYPAALLPIIAKRAGAYSVEININPTVISFDLDETLTGKSAEILPELVQKIKEIRNN